MKPTARPDDVGGAIVVPLAAYRAGVSAAQFLRGIFHHPAWLKEMKAVVTQDGSVRLVVVLRYETVLIRRCLPTSVDRIPVCVVVEEAR